MSTTKKIILMAAIIFSFCFAAAWLSFFYMVFALIIKLYIELM